MDIFDNSDLEYLVDDFHGASDFEEDESFGVVVNTSETDSDFVDSDFEDDFEPSNPKTDTSALEAKKGKDIQGIPWERLNYTRDRYRKMRLQQYKNFESLSRPREELDKECLHVEKGKTFYDFQFNTRLVKPTIAHFQCSHLSFAAGVLIHTKSFSFADNLEGYVSRMVKAELINLTTSVLGWESSWRPKETFVNMLRNLLWATSKHDVYFMRNYSLMHWSSLLQRDKEVLNAAKPIVPTMKQPGLLSKSLSRVQVSTMTVKDDLIVAGGFQGELICKKINEPEVAFCTKLTSAGNDITNAVDIYNTPSGSLRGITANNDGMVRIFDATNFAFLNSFAFDWSVNNISPSPDGKLVAVLGDSTECLVTDAGSGKVIHRLEGHLDYSFTSAWHPDGQILATGNQDTTCRLWDMRNLSETVKVLKGNMGAIRALRFTSDGRFLAMAEPADFVHVFDTQADYTKCQEIDLFGEIAGISFSPDTEALFVGVADRTYGSLLEFNRNRNHLYLDSIF